MSNAPRVRRVADQLQRELAAIISNEIKDPRVGMVTVTDVEVTPDFKHAKVYVTSLVGGRDADHAEMLAGLGSAAGFMRSLIGRRVKIHTTPELHFIYDRSIERGIRLSHLIDEAVKDAPAPDPEPGDAKPNP